MRSQRRIWTTAAVATAAVTGVLVFQGVTGGSSPAGEADAKSAPAEADVYRTPLKTSEDGASASLPKRSTERFSLLGVTWTDPAAKVTGRVEARTRSAATGEWTGWLPLDTEIDGRTEAGRAGVRGTTEPRWVGPSNGVEVRISAADGVKAGLPAGLRLDTVDPGGNTTPLAAEPAAFAAEPAAFAAEETPTEEPTPSDEPSSEEPSEEPSPEPPAPTATTASPTPPAPSPTPSRSATPSPPPTTASPTPSVTPTPTATTPPTLPPAPPSTAPQPTIVSRVAWKADESLNSESPDYLEKVKAVFVHHTAQTNSYSCADSAAIVRGLHTYHVKSNGWKDLGYNFVVDKCGTIFEGRKGGVDRAVMGAHTYGFNRDTTGIAVIGMHTDTTAASAATTAVARVAAWKLGQYQGNPAGTVQLTAGAAGGNFFGAKFAAGVAYPFQQISGHRDGFNTQCPGGSLYGQLPTIRSQAAALVTNEVTGLAITSVTGASASGSTYYTKSDITVGWKAATPAAFVKSYELLVGGKPVATVTGNDTKAAATLAVGRHSVQVRATHQSGKVTTSAAATVVADRTAPVFTTKPALTLRAGTVNTGAVPLTLKWKATDATALKEVRLTAPVAKTYGPTTGSASHTAKSGVATAWKMAAYDRAGNTAAASVSGTPVILQETSATKTGKWTAKSSSSYLGGKSLTSSAKGASLTWTFTGRSAAWVVSRAATSGQAYVYVDGTKVATVDLKSSTTKYRDAIWTRSWSTSAKHTVKIVVVGTSGRPTLTTDGLVYLK
ncbi:N-acetylmuramoyl-L-alanine amidase [Streptomyces sp. ISL-112]|uniref:N-acetylmuramoyl-L-alanine amidase n=1 Tax=unclassified Streptomyces TaxID=2593676 RepID=UPI001BE6A2B2|nr:MULTISPECIES: N-acetylmuramoyl-L-alanine amidase [unclassified Streptomyces]MBT2428818.1 N-acetylmuramoyl-L-alanine amidase [Streptomyces sp. ISL-112]MBT2461234.1 N-acetylmuramoyl-L-alanine amidase [Streptomyces sp. ISL-63]